MRRLAATTVGLLLAAQTAGAAVTARLTPLPARPAATGGLLPARLAIADPNGSLPGVARAVALRRTAGGPTILQPVSFAPRSSQEVQVLLPVLSAQERYSVRLLAGANPSSPVLAKTTAALEVADLALVEMARNLLVDGPAYEGRLEDLPRWPAWLLRTAFLTAAVICLALGSTLLIRRPAGRLLAAAVVVATGLAAAAYLLGRCPIVQARQADGLTIVTCLRTTRWSCPAGGLAPIYWSPQRLDTDDMIYRPDGDLTAALTPSEPRIFRHTARPSGRRTVRP